MFGLLLIGLGADPTFTVVNRCPPAFVVENKVPAKVVAPARTGYPVRGNWWTHPGEIHDHLINSPEHWGKWPSDWVRGLTKAEAEALHSDHHERRVKWEYVPGGEPYKPVPPIPFDLPALSNCPGGVCPTSAAPARRGLFGLFR